jgi:DNA-binding NarL/FixJ family response regulator
MDDNVVKTNSQANIVLLVDPLPLRRALILGFLMPWAEHSGLNLVPVDPAEALRHPSVAVSRLILLVLGAKRLAGSEYEDLISSLRKQKQAAAMAILSERQDSEEIVTAFKAGARAFVPLYGHPLIATNALTFVMNGGSYFPPDLLAEAAPAEIPRAVIKMRLEAAHARQLSARQHEVFEGLCRGESNREIARRLGLEESTVKVHVRQIMRKLGATNRTQAALRALTHRREGD